MGLHTAYATHYRTFHKLPRLSTIRLRFFPLAWGPLQSQTPPYRAAPVGEPKVLDDLLHSEKYKQTSGALKRKMVSMEADWPAASSLKRLQRKVPRLAASSSNSN